VDQSKERFPKGFQVSHQYDTMVDERYQVGIKVCNEINCIFIESSMVNIEQCGPPLLSFEDDTPTFKRYDSKVIVANWETPSLSECELPAYKFMFGYRIDQISISDSDQIDIYSLDIKKKIDFDAQKVSIYVPRKFFKKVGIYTLNLTMKSSITTDVYSVPLTVLPSPLQAGLVGGNRTIQRIEYNPQLNATVYAHFEMDASVSSDPDNPGTGVEGMTFNWYCRRSSMNPVSTTKEQKQHLYSNTVWQKMPYNQAKFNLSTEEFAAGVVYVFKVVVEKGGRSKGEKIQFIKISASMLPAGVMIT